MGRPRKAQIDNRTQEAYRQMIISLLAKNNIPHGEMLVRQMKRTLERVESGEYQWELGETETALATMKDRLITLASGQIPDDMMDDYNNWARKVIVTST